MRPVPLLSLLLLSGTACTPTMPEDVRGTTPGTPQEPDVLTDTGGSAVACEDGPAFADFWAGGLDPALVTETPYTFSAGLDAARTYMQGGGGEPPFVITDAVVLNLTTADGAVDTLWLGDASGAMLTYGVNLGLTAAEVQPGDTVSLTISAATYYQGLYEITGISGLVEVTGDAEPIYVVDGNSTQVSVDSHASQNVRGYGALVNDEGECGSRQCFTFRYGSNSHTLRVSPDLGLAVGDCVDLLMPLGAFGGNAQYNIDNNDWLSTY